LDLLSQGPRTVENLAQESHLTVANTSRHLQILRTARLIEAEKVGVFVRYHVADDAVVDFELKDRLREHRRDQEIVACCLGPYCVFAAQAVERYTRPCPRPRPYRAAIGWPA
jgi:DNA-binding transcriptional ArsR family regulator